MNAYELAELRLWLNKTGRKNWNITKLPPTWDNFNYTDQATSPDRIQINLRSDGRHWRAWLSISRNNPGYPSDDVFTSGETPADACRNAIAEAELSSLL